MSLGSYSSPIPIPLVRHAKRGAEPGPNEMNGRRLRDGRRETERSDTRRLLRRFSVLSVPFTARSLSIRLSTSTPPRYARFRSGGDEWNE